MISLYLPYGLPAITTLRREGAVVGTFPKAEATSPTAFPSGVLRILFLNLMPQKEVTELDIARMMVGRKHPVALLPMKISGQTYKTTPQVYIDAFYTDFEAFENQNFDGLIITGAPVEKIPFEDVRYWSQLCHIMDWACVHVRSTLYICWGAQAGLYHHYGVPKYMLPAKKFGIFTQQVLAKSPLMRGLSPSFPMPTSRHTEIRLSDIEQAPLDFLATGAESGVAIVASADSREVFITGHLEYAPRTLDNEYKRDLAKHLPIAKPLYYYNNDNPADGINFSWHTAARRFYGNWLHVCAE